MSFHERPEIHEQSYNCPRCNHIMRYPIFINPETGNRIPYDYDKVLFREMGDTITQQQKLIDALMNDREKK